jgi:hypothetical protein
MGRHAAPKRKRTYEDDDFAKFLGRALVAMERRASENPEALALLMTLQDEMKDSVNRAGVRLHADAGFSLGDIARFLTFEGHAMSRQNAVKRWGPASVARALGLPSITEKINARRTAVRDAAERVWGDELAARREARKAV